MKHRPLLLSLLCGLIPAIANAQGDPATIDRIIDQGKNHSEIMQRLRYVCERIGARLTSSPELLQGQEWAVSQFRKFGLKNVHLEEWGEAPVGFDRGPLQVARMVEPFESEMVFTTPAWTNGTNGLVKAEAVLAPATPEEVPALGASLRGKWVVMPTPGPRLSSSMLDALLKVGAAGAIAGSRNELVVTGGSWNGKTFENHPGIPQITVRQTDYDRVVRNIRFGRHPILEIGAENRWFKGPVKQYNVVADLVGSKNPDEMVIVSGHFDSWNGPGSQGALDNGVGSMTAMEAARALTAAHAKPDRTIRFILWSGEEEGLYGSKAYVKAHPELMPKISAVLVDDGGTNYQGGYDCIASQKGILEAAFAPVVRAFPNMPEVTRVHDRMARGGGSDHASFNAVGVPGFFTIETGRANYTFVHHTQHDRYEEAIPEYLVQSGTNHAVVAYNLACLPTLLPRDAPPAQAVIR